MKVDIFTNSQKPIGPVIEALAAKADDVFIASAYISNNAVKTLIQRCNARVGAELKSVDVLFGIDLDTDPSALQSLLDACEQSPNVFRVRYTPNKAGRLFHPKVYYFQCGQTCHIIIGSANLTHRGHYANEEMYSYIQCPLTSDLIEQVRTIRRAWLSKPFSAELDREIVDPIQLISDAKAIIANTLSGTGIGSITICPPSNKSLLLREINEGYMVSTDFSIAALSVPIPIRKSDSGKGESGNVVIVRSSLTARVQLLPDEVLKEFASLHQKAQHLVEQHSIVVPSGGRYIPWSAHKSFSATVRSLRNEHKRLIKQYIGNKSPIDTYLATHLQQGCENAWYAHQHENGIMSQSEILKTAQERIKERRDEFKKSDDAVPQFVINSYQHPLIARAENPVHRAWELHDVKIDEELLATIIAVLSGQIEPIMDATKRKQLPSVKDDLNRAKLLKSIRGEKIDSLLASLSRLANKDWEKVHKHRKPQFRSKTPGDLMKDELNMLMSKAKEHAAWLKGVKRKKPEEAFGLLLQEYPSIGSSA